MFALNYNKNDTAAAAVSLVNIATKLKIKGLQCFTKHKVYRKIFDRFVLS